MWCFVIGWVILIVSKDHSDHCGLVDPEDEDEEEEMTATDLK